MKRRLTVLALIAVAFGSGAAAQTPQADQRRSGYHDMSDDTRAMQDNDRANPGMLWVFEGERLWNLPAGEGLRSCSGCHGDASKSMAGVAARYPAFDIVTGVPRDLTAQIRFCRTDNQKAAPWGYESRPLLAMAAYVALQSRGEQIKPPSDLRLDVFFRSGKALFNRRIGQLNLSCAGCHDENAGKRLGASLIPQAHPAGYPVYRLEWQGLGSLQRRLRNCMTGVRAEAYPFGAQELVDLEVFLMQRAAGMAFEAPAVRP